MDFGRDARLSGRLSHYVGKVLVAASLVGGGLFLFGRTALGQRLTLSATLGKETFFEGEPIYAVFDLRNEGPDTAWVGIFGLGPDRLRLSLRQLDGSLLPEAQMWTDYGIPPGWRGVPIAPGEHRYQTVILQDVVGKPVEPRWTVFPKHIRPGTYTLIATFNASVDGVGAPTPEVVASPLPLEVRSRTSQEDRSVQEIERICALAWNRDTRSRYLPALLALIEARFIGDSSDVFLAFLTNDAVMTGRAAGVSFGARDVERLNMARLGIARVQRAMPSGAMAGVTLLGDAPAATTVSTLLGASLAADVVREREKARSRGTVLPGRPQ